jgi:hypothetical protein
MKQHVGIELGDARVGAFATDPATDARAAAHHRREIHDVVRIVVECDGHGRKRREAGGVLVGELRLPRPDSRAIQECVLGVVVRFAFARRLADRLLCIDPCHVEVQSDGRTKSESVQFSVGRFGPLSVLGRIAGG